MSAITLSDVVSHPAYKLYIQDTSITEIERMRHIVFAYDAFSRINERVKKFRLSERVPAVAVDGFDHYKECVWSDPLCTSGPDTCVCSLLSGECYTVIRMLDTLLERTDEDCTATTNASDKSHGR